MDITVATRIVEQMRSSFDECLAMAKTLKTPNSEDTDEIKCAIIGFSTCSDTASWSRDHYDFLRSRLDEVPEMYESQVRFLQAMCLGHLCGMAFERKITEKEFQLADMQLPGYLLALGGKVKPEPSGGTNASSLRRTPKR